MSNKLQLPSINPWNDVVFKGNATFEDDVAIVGDLGVGGNSVFTGTTTFLGNITLPSLSALHYQEITIFVPTIVSATAAICVSTSQIAGTINSISVVTNGVTATGPATFTASIIHSGVTTAITNGVTSVATTDAAFLPNTVVPTGNNDIVKGDVLKIVVGGTNTNAGTAHITFRVLVA